MIETFTKYYSIISAKIFKMKALLKGAKQIVQVVNGGEKCLTGENMKNIALIETKSSGLSIVID